VIMSCIQVGLKQSICNLYVTMQVSTVFSAHTQLISGIILNVCISIIRDVSMKYFSLFCFFNISMAKHKSDLNHDFYC